MAMHTWFECRIRYDKVMENGIGKKVTEPYLVDALSFTEAEARIIEEMAPFILGDFTVSDIKRANYSELFTSDEESADRWFKCKLVFITLNEKSDAERKSSTQILVQASDLRDAVRRLDEGMKGTMADYQIVSIVETAIMDVFPYGTKGDNTVEVEFESETATISKSVLEKEACFGIDFRSGLHVDFEHLDKGIIATFAIRNGISVQELFGKTLKYRPHEKT